jgi:hypothetical protein
MSASSLIEVVEAEGFGEGDVVAPAPAALPAKPPVKLPVNHMDRR